MFEKIKNYAYYAALIFFFIISIEAIYNGGHYAGLVVSKNFAGTNLGLLIYLTTITGGILQWLGAAGLVILTYIYKNL